MTKTWGVLGSAALALALTACSAGNIDTGSLSLTAPEGKPSSKAAAAAPATVTSIFYENARQRIADRAKSPPASTGKHAAPPQLRRPGATPTQAYSGTPDNLSREHIASSGGVIEMPQAQTYLHRITRRLLAEWPYEPLRVGVFPVNQDAFDANITAAGDIIIASGMLTQLESEDELAAVLAHELAHILLYHHERAEQVAANKRAMNAAASAAIVFLMFRNTDWRKTGKGSYQGTLNTGNWMKQSLYAGGACLASTYFVDKLIDPGWNRTQEDEADLLGIDLMIRAGYNPNAALQAMRRRIDYEGATRKSLVDQRQQNGDYSKMVDDAVKQQGILGVFTGAARSVTAGIIDTFSDVDDYISQRHRMSSDRLKTMQLYLDQHYANRERTALQTKDYQATFRSGLLATAMANHQMARDASRALHKNEVERAADLARKSIQPPTQHALATRLANYEVAMAMGKEPEAFQHLLAVKSLENAPPQYFLALADGYARRGDEKRAAEAQARAREIGKTIYDPKDKNENPHLLSALFSNHDHGHGASRFEVKGFCEDMKTGVGNVANSISGR